MRAEGPLSLPEGVLPPEYFMPEEATWAPTWSSGPSWGAHDGRLIREPRFLACGEWAPVNGLMHFATFEATHRLGFDLRRRNDAEQWDILNVDTGFRVTLTMARFWSNKVLAWVDKRRAVWEAWAPPA